MAIQLTTVAASIAAVSISGVTIKGLGAIPDQWDTRVPALIPFPNTNEFITDLEITRDTFGTNATAKKTIKYQLHYTFFYSQVGEGRAGLEKYADMITLAMQMLDAFHAATLGGSLQSSVMAQNFGRVADVSDNVAYGCEFVFSITEFIN